MASVAAVEEWKDEKSGVRNINNKSNNQGDNYERAKGKFCKTGVPSQIVFKPPNLV